MTADRVATLLSTLAATPSRRAALSALCGLGLAGLLGETEAKKSKKHRKKKCAKRGRAPNKKRKRCCRGLARDETGRCAAPSPASPPPPAPSPPCDVCGSGCPFSRLEVAIASVSPGATLTVCPGTYVESLIIGKDLTLIGAGPGADPAANTILRGTGTGSVLTILNSVVTLRRLRITGGHAGDNGGGINNAGDLTMTGCTVIENTAAGRGGGIFNVANLTLTNSTVRGNMATGIGGGIYNDGGALRLTTCTVRGNTAVSGAGVANGDLGTAELTDSTVNDNRAESSGTGNAHGGGLINVGTLTLTNCTVSGNTSDLFGGGIHNTLGTVRLVNSTVTDNTTTFGGGISNDSNEDGTPRVQLTDSTVSGNHAADGGGGIYNEGLVTCDAVGAVSGNTAKKPPITSNCVNSGGTGCDTCNP
jgi:hypothetical protein